MHGLTAKSRKLITTIKNPLSPEEDQSILIKTSSQNHPQLIRDSRYVVLPQTFLYRISTMQSFKSYLKISLNFWNPARKQWPKITLISDFQHGIKKIWRHLTSSPGGPGGPRAPCKPAKPCFIKTSKSIQTDQFINHKNS